MQFQQMQRPMYPTLEGWYGQPDGSWKYWSGHAWTLGPITPCVSRTARPAEPQAPPPKAVVASQAKANPDGGGSGGTSSTPVPQVQPKKKQREEEEEEAEVGPEESRPTNDPIVEPSERSALALGEARPAARLDPKPKVNFTSAEGSPASVKTEGSARVHRVNWTFPVFSADGWDLLEAYDSPEEEEEEPEEPQDMLPFSSGPLTPEKAKADKVKKHRLALKTVLEALIAEEDDEEIQQRLRKKEYKAAREEETRLRKVKESPKKHAPESRPMELDLSPKELLQVLPHMSPVEKQALCKALKQEVEGTAADHIPEYDQEKLTRPGHRNGGYTYSSKPKPKPTAAGPSTATAASSSAGSLGEPPASQSESKLPDAVYVEDDTMPEIIDGHEAIEGEEERDLEDDLEMEMERHGGGDGEEREPPLDSDLEEEPEEHQRPYGFNKTLHIDVKYLWDARGKRYAALSILDLGTCKHDAHMIKTRRSDYVASKFLRKWIQPYGSPELIVHDQGGEFEGAFVGLLEQFSISSKVTGAHAGWQLGVGERHGDLLGQALHSVVAEHTVEGYTAMKEALACSKAVSRLLRQRGIHAPRLSRKRKLEPQPEAKPEKEEEVDEEYTPTEAPVPPEDPGEEVKEDEPMDAEEPVERVLEPHEIPVPADDDDWEDETWEEAARQEWQQEEPERRRQRLMDDVPISIKRKLTEDDAGLPNKKPRIHASWIVQAMTAAAAGGPDNEWVSRQELETLKKLTGPPLSAARKHRKPRKRLMRPPKAISRSRLSILIGEDPMDAFVVDEDESEVTAAPKRKVAFYWKGMTMLYKRRGRKPQATYVQLPTGVYKACLGAKDRREFEQLWLEELKDVLVNEVMILKLKQNGKELDPRWFNEQEKKAFDLSDAKEWEQWLNNEVVQKVQEDQLTTWGSGSYERDTVIKGLRRLEKVTKEKSTKVIFDEYDAPEDPDYTFIEDDEGTFIFLLPPKLCWVRTVFRVITISPEAIMEQRKRSRMEVDEAAEVRPQVLLRWRKMIKGVFQLLVQLGRIVLNPVSADPPPHTSPGGGYAVIAVSFVGVDAGSRTSSTSRQGQLIHYDYPLADDTVPQYDQGGHAYIQSNAINSGGQDVESINSPEEDAGKLQCSQLECDPRLPGKPSITRLAWTQSKGHETPVSTPSSKTHREEIGTHARFYNCPRHLCKYFEWDPIEVKVLQELDNPGTMRTMQSPPPPGTPPDVQEKIELEMWRKKLQEQEKELSEKQASIEQLRQRSEEIAVKTQMEGQALLMQQHQAHLTETQQLRDQLIWLSCVAGPERLKQARTDPDFHQETVNQAKEYKKMFEEQGAGPTN
ncbi:unnamed protein product [Durusdinium trenchii]|uniref:Integrase catalytic domain-containing protein n=1 Tax=Durusdinium trenchii TaxID=1381693 RepID=A0ABP0PZB9_9DINO